MPAGSFPVGSLRVFSLVFGLAYAAAAYFKYPLFRYYPALQRFSMTDIPGGDTGPAMSWFGWMATGAIAAIVVTAVVPRRLGDRLWPGFSWLVPLVMLVAGFLVEKAWFLA